jgi:hypothetical protein
MTNPVAQIVLLCGLIELSILKGALEPHQLTKLFELVRENPGQHEQALRGLSSIAKQEFRLYCCLQGQYYLRELGNHKNSGDQLLKSAIRLIEVGTILKILGEDSECTKS